MPTFLTTPKMSPALAARIVASVGGKRPGTRGKAMRPRASLHLITLVRFGVPIAILTLLTTIVHFVRQDRLELERARSGLLEVVRGRGASLTPVDRGKLIDVGHWLDRLSGAYEGDLTDPELRAAGALDALLSRPTLYVRGPLAAFGTAAGSAEAAAASPKDAFVRCLLDPPASRAEKVVLAQVLAGHAASDATFLPVHRLDDAEVVLPFFQPAWVESVRSAPDLDALLRQRRQLDKAPLERGIAALKANLLVVAMDEPNQPGPTELDGEGSHEVRVSIVDLGAAIVRVRLRKHVDPAWITPTKRAMHASALDGCVLAMDVRDAVTKAAP